MQLFRRQQSIIGLDIGTSMIKAVKMNMKGDNYVLENFALEPIEEGAIQSGEVKNPSSLAQSAITAVEKCDPNVKDVAVALPNYSILSDVLTMDLIPKKEMHEAVMVEAERISPFDISEVEIDYAVLEQNEETKQMKVLLVAAKNDIVLSYVDCMNEAGLRTVIMDVDLFALLNIFQMNYDPKIYSSCIIINIGTETTDAAFLQNGLFHSARDISVAGSNYQDQLGMATSLPPEKIHDILNSKIDPELDFDTIINSLNSVSKEFANAVGVAVSYFQTSDAVGKLDLIILAGGYALVPGLINILELRTGTEVVVLNPFNNITYDESLMVDNDSTKMGIVLSVAMGLAARTF